MKQVLITVDVEDWFQVENFKTCIPFSAWSSCRMRVERNTHVLLDLLDSMTMAVQPTPISAPPDSANPSTGNVLRATFFVLGWIAQRLPNLVREIESRGHEVASHGNNHCLHSQCSPEVWRKDLTDSKKLLEDIIGREVYGYRAPSFSVDDNVLKVIEDCGYHYDSSFNSFQGNGRYGKISLSNKERCGIAYKIADTFYELPISNLRLGSQFLPVGGGGYFRIFPLPFLHWSIGRILEKDQAYLFYIHPWEIDPDQPRVKECSWFSRWRHYHNLHETMPKLTSLIQCLRGFEFTSCRHYLENHSEYH